MSSRGGKYLRYHYVVADFSAVKDPGIYFIKYGPRQTGAFPIANDVYRARLVPDARRVHPGQHGPHVRERGLSGVARRGAHG